MKVYLDSSAIVKLYAPESDTAAVAEYVRGLTDPLPFSHLHEIEVKNALRLKVFRREADSRGKTRYRPACCGFSRTGFSPVGLCRRVSSAHWNSPFPRFAGAIFFTSGSLTGESNGAAVGRPERIVGIFGSRQRLYLSTGGHSRRTCLLTRSEFERLEHSRDKLR